MSYQNETYGGYFGAYGDLDQTQQQPLPTTPPPAAPDDWQNAALLAQTVASIGTDVYRASQGLPRQQPPPPPPLPPSSGGSGTAIVVGLFVVVGIVAVVVLGGKKSG